MIFIFSFSYFLLYFLKVHLRPFSSVANPDPGSGAFLTPGSGSRSVRKWKDTPPQINCFFIIVTFFQVLFSWTCNVVSGQPQLSIKSYLSKL
jgi:hypothetical protein